MPDTIVNDVRNPAGRADVTERARTVIEPPLPLKTDERFYWDAIIAARSVKEWESGISLHLALILSRMMAQLDRELVDFEADGGAVLIGSRGSPVPNPRSATIASLRAAILRYESRLQLDVEAGGDTERKAARTAERRAQARDEVADEDSELIQKMPSRRGGIEDLLPRPKPRSVQ